MSSAGASTSTTASLLFCGSFTRGESGDNGGVHVSKGDRGWRVGKRPEREGGEEGVYAKTQLTQTNKCYRVWGLKVLLEGEGKEEEKRRTRSTCRMLCGSRRCGCCVKVRKKREREGEGGEGRSEPYGCIRTRGKMGREVR
jgi:hypothetical protein